MVRLYGYELCALHHAKVLEIEKIEKLYSTIAAKREELKEIEIQKELIRKEVGK